jgi:hypothetical protein
MRTLLLNEEPAHKDVIGEEAVAEEFVPVTLTGVLMKIDSTIFRNGTREGKNRRLHELMTILHTTPELRPFVEEKDTRTTYLLTDGFWMDCWEEDIESLPDVVQELKQRLTYKDEEELFGEQPCEPYKTFRDMWRNSDHFPYKVGGLVLAMAYRVEEKLGAN